MYIKNQHSIVGVVGEVARNHAVGEHDIDIDRVMIPVIISIHLTIPTIRQIKKVATIKNAVIMIGNLGVIGAHATIMVKAHINENDIVTGINKVLAETKAYIVIPVMIMITIAQLGAQVCINYTVKSSSLQLQ